MAKLVVLMVFMIAVCLSLILYQGTDVTIPGTGGTMSENILYRFITNSNQWSGSNLWDSILGISLAVAGTGIVAGVMLGFVTDFMMFAVAIFGLMSIGFIFIQFQQLFRSELFAFFACTSAETCKAADWITWVIVAPIAFLYIWTVVEWWRGKDV